MTNLITEARELCEKATPGPWRLGEDETIETESDCIAHRLNTLQDAQFIARSRTLIPALCDALEKAEKEAQRWIPVSERLPEASGAYWVNLHQEDEDGNDADFCIEAWYQVNSLLFAPKEVGWQLLNEWYEFSGQMRQYISHWMPFPEPPEEGGEK